MTEAPKHARPKWPNRAPLRRLRRIVGFLNTFDPDEIDRLIEGFEKSQRKIESDQRKIETDQREMEGMLRVLSSEISALKNDLSQDRHVQQLCFFNVKNLGYDLGRILAERDLQKTVEEPGLIKLQSQLCRQDDFVTDWLIYWCREMRTAPHYHRKIWELCYICQVLFEDGKLAPERRGLGFGCGQEPLPSLFAKYGAQVTATDLDPNRPEAEVWRLTNQHAAAGESLRRRDICPDEQRLAAIEFRPIDMNSIPREFDEQFDFCWSACALEHLGSLANGLEFIENSLRTLKPGGVAVHTTEFTFDEGETIDNHPTVLYQSRHLVEFSDRMRQQGYEVAQYDFTAGSGVLDRFVDLPPWTHELYISPQQYAHLKLSVDGFTCTSIGMIIRKPVYFG